MSEGNTILFANPIGKYAFLSNSFKREFVVPDGKDYIKFKFLEQYYVYHRMKNPDVKKEVLEQDNMSKLSRLIKRSIKKGLDGWDPTTNSLEKRKEIMKEGLRLKFTQHEDLKVKLLETGDRELINWSFRDMVWGYDKDKKEGDNVLGKLIMEVRNELRSKKK